MLWLAKKDEHTEGRVWIRLAGRRVVRGRRVEFKVGAEIRRANRCERRSLMSRCKRLMDERNQCAPPRQAEVGRRRFADTTKPGDYRIVVKAKDGDAEIGTAEARFLVPNQDLELDRPAAEPDAHGATGRDDEAGRRRGTCRRKSCRIC